MASSDSGKIRFAASPLAHLPRADKRERDSFYRGKRWVELRARFLRKNPICGRCEAAGRATLAEVVHHQIERLDRPDLAYAWSNLEALCHQCHNRHHKSHQTKPAPRFGA